MAPGSALKPRKLDMDALRDKSPGSEDQSDHDDESEVDPNMEPMSIKLCRKCGQ